MRRYPVIVDTFSMRQCPQVDEMHADPDDAIRHLASIGRVETPEGYKSPWAALQNGQTVFAYGFNQLAIAASFMVENRDG